MSEEIIKTETFKPTDSMAANARRALKLKEDGKAKGAGTSVGWTRARQLANKEALTLDTVKRMYSFFSRHEVDKKGKDWDNSENPSNGKIMWLAWGGDSGFAWSRAIVNRMKKELIDEITDIVKNIGTTNNVSNDNNLEFYVRNGGDIMTNTTEPDPKGDIAITKSIPDGTKGPLIGQETRPTDGATSVSDAPNGDSAVVPGNATFESSATSAITPTRTNEMQVPDKVSVQKSTTCPDCGASMMHECMSKAEDSAEMEKAEVCSDCGKNPCECEKKSEDGNDKEPDADEDDVEKLKKEINRLNEELESLKKSEIQIENTHEQITKSVWGGAFSPIK